MGAAGVAPESWVDLNRNGARDVYEDPSQPVDQRVEDLLGRMTLVEKLGQLHLGLIKSPTASALAREGKAGAFLAYDTPDDYAVEGRALQQIAMKESRLGVPLLMGFDAIHGCRTAFPIPLAMSCAWDAPLIERVESAAAMECRELGIDWVYGPMVDLSRDPRWGRISEGFGEDPWLGSQLAAAAVRGLQGQDGRPGVAACLKHYVGYAAVEGGRDYNQVEITPYTLWNFYLPAFKSGVDAGAMSLMTAFNCNGGMAATANRYTVDEVLRQRWHFSGFVVSDYGSVAGNQGLINHGIVASNQAAAEMSLQAGVDMEMEGTAYWSLTNSLSAGGISPTVVDEAVRRILRVKFRLGLMDHAPAVPAKPKDWPAHPELNLLARQAAIESCVLLKNQKETLPLDKKVRRIALIGPMAQSKVEPLGCWSQFGVPEEVVSLEEGIRAKFSGELLVARGCDLQTNSRAGFEAALAAARKADRIILAVGEPAAWTGETHSRSTLGLTGVQQELFDQVAALGKPVVVVLCNGRPLAIPQMQQKAAAILETWFLGYQSGHAIAEILFGDANPSGKLTTSFPESVGQVPVYYNHLRVGRGYMDGPSAPLYPFGFGLSYTHFKYSPVALSAQRVKVGQPIQARVTVSNGGKRDGEEVVQLYIRDVAASAGARPVKELKGFQRITLSSGERREVTFTLTDKELGYYTAEGQWLVEPGWFKVWIASDSSQGEEATFEMVR
jgi:beta-glucosidase